MIFFPRLTLWRKLTLNMLASYILVLTNEPVNIVIQMINLLKTFNLR